jgi:hypothetical protein
MDTPASHVPTSPRPHETSRRMLQQLLLDVCTRLVALVAREAEMQPAIQAADEAQYRRLTGTLDVEWAAIEPGLATAGPPVTIAGARAAAGAVLALEPAPGREPGSMAIALAWRVCMCLATSWIDQGRQP